jgi:MoxR-like ATPase
MSKFTGTSTYVATEDLRVAVNAAIALERPLLIKGEPGTGKTILAQEVATALGKRLISWHIKSTTKAQQGLYEYDAVSRLRDSQLGEAKVHDIANYIVKGKLWEAFDAADAPGPADRRDRQGRYRVSQRPPARARPHGILRLRDAPDGEGTTAANRLHHLEQ